MATGSPAREPIGTVNDGQDRSAMRMKPFMRDSLHSSHRLGPVPAATRRYR
jgi:hypothetical protein